MIMNGLFFPSDKEMGHVMIQTPIMSTHPFASGQFYTKDIYAPLCTITLDEKGFLTKHTIRHHKNNETITIKSPLRHHGFLRLRNDLTLYTAKYHHGELIEIRRGSLTEWQDTHTRQEFIEILEGIKGTLPEDIRQCLEGIQEA